MVPMLCFAVWGLNVWGGAGTISNVPESISSKTAELPEPYGTIVEKLTAKRANFHTLYLNADAAGKPKILSDAGAVLGNVLADEMIPHWYGTAWDFNGTSTIPGKGQIACGYFVTTLLRDAGMKVPRVKMAQQASSVIMKSLDNGKNPTWYSNISAEDFASKMAQQPAGLYLLGLDYHTGFIYVKGGEVWFLHSNYLQPQEVLKEKAAKSPAISASNVKVVGRISTSEWLVKKWLNQEDVPVL